MYNNFNLTSTAGLKSLRQLGARPRPAGPGPSRLPRARPGPDAWRAPPPPSLARRPLSHTSKHRCFRCPAGIDLILMGHPVLEDLDGFKRITNIPGGGR